MTLSGLVTERALAYPDRECIVDVSRTWTYAEAALAIEQHCAALVAAGVRKGDRVGVHFNKSAEGFVAMHAAVSVGAIAVPLDPASPVSRLARICEQMQISVVSSHTPRKKSLEALHEKHPLRALLGADVALDGCDNVDADAIAILDGQSPVLVSPDDFAYIVTTSGSTGEPKGIVHSHASGRSYADMTVNTFGLDESDRVSDISPHHFDISCYSLWATPLVGATNIVVNEAYQRLPASHSQLLVDQRVTVWYSVPFLLQQLVRRGDLTNRNLEMLRWVHFAGEVLAADVVVTMMEHCPNARFVNIFGPAETNHVTHAIFDAPPEIGVMLPAGVPIDGATIRIVDPEAEEPLLEHLVAVGEVGEMWTATPQLMAGYWQNDAANERSLKEVDGLCFYRSGDLMSRNEAGDLSFHGRTDHQVKLRGYRIELEGIESELESLVREMGSAENVVVSIRRQTSGEDELVAGILGSTPSFDDAEFTQRAASVVPAYAVPTRTIQLESPAFTGSGKLDRRTLRETTVQLLEDTSLKDTSLKDTSLKDTV